MDRERIVTRIDATSRIRASPEIIAPPALGVLLSVAFVAWELRAGHPMIPIRLFGQRSFAAGNATAFTVFAMLLALVFFMAQYLQNALGYTPLGAGLRLLPGWATLAVIAPFAGALIAQLVAPLVLTGGVVSVAAGLALLGALAGLCIPGKSRPARPGIKQPTSPQLVQIGS
jgi:hypothetical protein